MGRLPKRLTYMILICTLAFGVMPAASFGEDDTVGVDTDDAEAHPRFAPERLFSDPGQRQDDWETITDTFTSQRLASTDQTRAGTARIPR